MTDRELDERPIAPTPGPVDRGGEMPSAPAVTCTACAYEWRSRSMAEGLRLIGSCPRCDGALEFHEPAAPPLAAPAAPGGDPHLVLGVPRISGT